MITDEENKRLDELMLDIRKKIDQAFDSKKSSSAALSGVAGVLIGLAIGKLSHKIGMRAARKCVLTLININKNEASN